MRLIAGIIIFFLGVYFLRDSVKWLRKKQTDPTQTANAIGSFTGAFLFISAGIFMIVTGINRFVLV